MRLARFGVPFPAFGGRAAPAPVAAPAAAALAARRRGAAGVSAARVPGLEDFVLGGIVIGRGLWRDLPPSLSSEGMSAPSGPVPILFEAVSTPRLSMGRSGLTLLAVLLGSASALLGLTLALFGAWPVLGFMGAEVALVLTLMALHLRWSRRALEVVVLTEAALTVRRTDGRGRQEEAVLQPYWARLQLLEHHGRVSELVLWQRGRRVEIGRFLAEEEKRDLAEALSDALRRYREPVFDNPQL
jgi:uncharacterized membrane protein